MVALPLIYWLMDRQRGWMLALVFLSSMQLNATIKELTEVPRPFQADARVESIGPKPSTYAFPSGHAQGSMLIWGSLAAMYPSPSSIGVCGSIIFLVGVTRLYLGVHSPLDVSVGWGFGGIGVALMFALFKLSQKNPETLRAWRTRLFWVIAGGGMIIVHPSKDTVLAGATLTAVATLEHYERKWIGFDNCQQIWRRIGRLAAGFIPAGLLVVYYKHLVPDSLWMIGIFFYLLGGWMVLGAPYLFKRLRI